MKKLIASVLLAAALIVLFAFFADAADGVVYTLSEDKSSYILSSYTKNEPEVRISSEYNGLPVTKIASGAFSGNVSTYKIIIPASISYVEDGAFSAMPSLYEFEASGNYTEIDGVLYTADEKTLVRFPEAREGGYKTPDGVIIGAYAFSGCRITSLDAGGAVMAGDYAFYFSDIKNVVLSASLRMIGAHAFEKSAIEKIRLPGRTSVSAYAFASCEDLVYADISSASLDGDGAFYSDTSLIAVSFPQSQTTVPELTFAGCTSLITAPIGQDVRIIGSKAFYGCVNLEHASCGSAGYEPDSFGLCGKLVPDKKAFAPLSQKNAEITLKVGESYKTSGSEYDLFTVSHTVGIVENTVTALFEGEAEVYAVSRKGGDCAVISVKVSDGAGVLESAHPYHKGTGKYKYTVSGSPERIAVTFSPSDMLASADALKIQDKNGNLYGTYYGSSLAGKTLFIDGDTVEITLIAVNSGAYGFRITSAVPARSLVSVSKITLPEKITVKAGESVKLSPSVSPANASPKELLYVTGDKNIASVKNDGTVYGVKAGNTEITVYSAFYGVSAKCAVSVVPGSGENDFEYEIKDGGAYITGYAGVAGACSVPSMLGGFEVRGINDGAFAFRGITELYLPECVSYFSPYSVDGNSSLSGLYAADKSEYFKTAGGALYSKDGKTLIRVPCGAKGAFTVPDGVAEVSDGAFSCCFGIERVAVAGSVERLSGGAFVNCANLKYLTAVGNNFTVVDGVLYSYDKKTLVYFPAALNISAYSVNAGTENIGAHAFDSAVNLKSVVLPASVSNADGTALRDAFYVKNITVNSSNAVYSVSDGALYENSDLKFVPKSRTGVLTVKEGTGKILPYALYNCAYVTGVSLPSSVSAIGDHAFGRCSSLNVLYLPDSIKTIGYDAFEDDEGLSVYIPDGARAPYLSDCTVMCGKDTEVCEYCEQNGTDHEYVYRSEYGIYTVYTPVDAELRVTEEKDPVVLSRFRAAAGQSIKAFSVYLLSDGVKLPAGEYALYRQNTSSKRYYYENGALSEIKQDAVSIYRRRKEYVIELSGNTVSASLSVKTLPDKLEYTVYDTFDSTGLSLYYTDENGLTTVIYDGFNLRYDLRTAGEKTVKVKYMDLVAEFNISVRESVLSGEINITGKPRYGSTLTADTSGVSPNDAELSYQWYADGTPINGADKSSYKPGAEDIGKKLSVKVTASGVKGELMSDQVTVGKAASPAPPKPVIESADQTMVVLKKVDGCEYKLSSDNGFTDNNKFEGLTPGKTYVFCQRYKETDATEASDISSVSYETKKDYKITSDKYFVNPASGAVSLIDPKTTVKALLPDFSDSELLSVYRDGVKLDGDDTVGTGCEIRLTVNGRICDKCVTVITGDVNGDGKITITDYLKIKERIQNGTSLSKEKEYAADVNGDGKVTITDYLRLKYCIQNGVKPEQNRY